MIKNLVVAIAVAGFSISSAFAGPGGKTMTYLVDTAHSNVSFKVRHLVSRVNGAFKDYEATIKYDPAHPEAIIVTGTVKATSVDTGNTNRRLRLY